jgi:hypothetical protein
MTAHNRRAALACLPTLVFSTTSCPFWCDDCVYSPCPAGCTEGECEPDFSSALDTPLSSEPVQWLTRLTVGGCQEAFTNGRLVRIQCDAERGSIFAEVFYTDDGHARAIDVHNYPRQLETASQHFDLVTDQDGRITESTLIFLEEIERVETFAWDGDRVASTQATESRSRSVTNTVFIYDEAGTLRTVDIGPITVPPPASDFQQLTYTFDEERRPVSFTAIDLRSGSTLQIERNVYDGSGTPPSTYELDYGGDGIDELIAFHYEDGRLVSFDTDRAPIGSIDSTTSISDNCCGQWCIPQ